MHGVHCSPTIEFKTSEYFMKTGRASLRLQEVQELALHCILGTSCLPCPRWAFLTHQVRERLRNLRTRPTFDCLVLQPLVARFVAIFVDDLDATTLACNMRMLPNM